MCQTLTVITQQREQLKDVIEPYFGLLDVLVSSSVLTNRQCQDVQSVKALYRKNDQILDFLTTEEQCEKFLRALEITGQLHVVNFINRRGESHVSLNCLFSLFWCDLVCDKHLFG